MATAEDDRALVERCLAGEDSAWSALVDRFRRLVYSVPVRFRMSGEQADEVFQRTFVSLFRSLGGLRDTKRLASFLAATAANHARLLFREGRRRRTAEMEDVPDRAPEAGETLRRLEDAAILRAGLERIDGRCRALLDLLFFSGDRPSYEEVGERLGLPVGSIGPTRARCFEKLRKAMVSMGYRE